MRNREFVVLAAVAIGLAACTATSTSTLADPVPPAEPGPPIESVSTTVAVTVTTTDPGSLTLVDLVDENSPTGVGALFFGMSDGTTTAHYARGVDGDGNPVTPDQAWETASLVKMIVATSVLQLVDAGQVGLDVPVADYVDFPVNGTVTVRDVLSHRSGIPDMTSQLSSCPIESTIEAMKTKVGGATGPTVETSYSNTNYLLLGFLVGHVTGIDIADYARASIFDPLGMTSTYWWETQDGPPVYWRKPLSDPGTPSPFTCPDTSVTVGNEGHTFVSTLSDLDAFLRGLFGGDLMTADSLDQMMPSEGADDGLGLWAETDDERGVTLYGHFGGRSGFSTVAYYDPANDRSMVAFGHDPIDVEALMWQAWDLADAAATVSTSVTEAGSEPPTDQATITTAVADEPGETVTFNGFSFRIGEGGSPYHIEVSKPSGGWEQSDGVLHVLPPTITATQDRIVATSPSPGEGSTVCREYVLTVSSSTNGTDWNSAAIDDLGEDIRRQEAHPTRRNANCIHLDGGGEAIGANGILIVRVITRCCIDPSQYPHFWFSPDGTQWQRASLPNEMTRIQAHSWGSPRSTPDGFAIDVTYADANADPTVVETWESANGLTWRRIDPGT